MWIGVIRVFPAGHPWTKDFGLVRAVSVMKLPIGELPEPYRWIRDGDRASLKTIFRVAVFVGPVAIVLLWAALLFGSAAPLSCPPEFLNPQVGVWESTWPKLKWEMNTLARRGQSSFGSEYCATAWSMVVVGGGATGLLSIGTFLVAFMVGMPPNWQSTSSRREQLLLFGGAICALSAALYIPIPPLITGENAMSYKLPVGGAAPALNALLLSGLFALSAMLSVMFGKMAAVRLRKIG